MSKNEPPKWLVIACTSAEWAVAFLAVLGMTSVMWVML